MIEKPVTGYYWYFLLDFQGIPIQSPDHPEICWYSAERDEIDLMGYDVPMSYNPEQYKLIRQIQFSDPDPKNREIL